MEERPTEHGLMVLTSSWYQFCCLIYNPGGRHSINNSNSCLLGEIPLPLQVTSQKFQIPLSTNAIYTFSKLGQFFFKLLSSL